MADDVKNQEVVNKDTVTPKKTSRYSKRIIIFVALVAFIALFYIISSVLSGGAPADKSKNLKKKDETETITAAQPTQALMLAQTRAVEDKAANADAMRKPVMPADLSSTDFMGGAPDIQAVMDKSDANGTAPQTAEVMGTPATQQQLEAQSQAAEERRLREEKKLQEEEKWVEYQRASFFAKPNSEGSWNAAANSGAADSKKTDGATSGGSDFLDIYSKLAQRPQQANTTANASSTQQNQSDKEKFFNSKDSGRGMLTKTRQPSLSPYMLPSGTLIPCTLISGVNSDLPGNVVAQVTENVCDWRNPDAVLIPVGTKVFGKYNSNIAFAQKRVQVSWSRLTYPDGSTLELDGMAGVDKQGYSGMRDKYYPRYGRLLTASIMTAALSSVGLLFDNTDNASTVITSSGTIYVPSSTTDTRKEFARAIAESIGQQGNKLFDKILNTPPTVLIRPATRFNIMINADVPFFSAWK